MDLSLFKTTLNVTIWLRRCWSRLHFKRLWSGWRWDWNHGNL